MPIEDIGKLKKEDITGNLFGDISKEYKTEKPSTGVVMIPLDESKAYHNHIYNVLEDHALKELTASVKKHGVKVPIKVRLSEKYGCPYERISGHRRWLAAKNAGLNEIPAIIEELTDDEADEMMVDENLHRPNITLYEECMAYKVKYDSLKRQGKKSKSGKRTDEEIAEEAGINRSTVQRKIRLTNLNKEMFPLITTDNNTGKIPMGVATVLSYLKKKEQQIIFRILTEDNVKIDKDIAEELKQLSVDGAFNEVMVKEVINGNHEDKPKKTTKFSLTEKEIKEWFPSDYKGSAQDKKDLIKELLKEHFENGEWG